MKIVNLRDGEPTALSERNRRGRNRRAGVYMMRWLRSFGGAR